MDNDFAVNTNFVKTPHGVFTNNEELKLTAQEYYEWWLEQQGISDNPKVSVEDLIKAQDNQIDSLKNQNATLLLDNAKKDIEIDKLKQNIANITLEVAKIKVGV